MGVDSSNRAGSGAAYSRFAEEMDIDSVNLSMRDTSTKSLDLRAHCINHWKTLIVLLISLLCFAIGIILGHFIAGACIVEPSTNGAHRNGSSDPVIGDATTVPANPTQTYLAMINGLIKKRSLQSNLQYYTDGPHYAGSQGNRDKASRIVDVWKSYGFEVTQKNYSVYLSRPSGERPNKIAVFDTSSQSPKNSFTPDDVKSADMLQPFAVYGSNASISNQPVYVNYGSTEDFNNMRDRTEIVYADRICLARLGKIPLAQMAQISKDRHCLALIAFPDPNPYASPDGVPMPDNTFPHTWWLPSDGVPRESARLSMGDPSTPFFPSSYPGIPRKPLVGVGDFPVLTVSYDTAKGLLRDMAPPPASDPDWIGGLPIDYNIGPGFHDKNLVLKFDVFNELALSDITNVFATIQGSAEPDRYVIIGNHRDSLASGVVSPGTGTACLMEVAKVLSKLRQSGWRPRRTIILASWDAGEDGLIGSTEWVEENMERLRSRGVAYINLDDAVSGKNSFAAAGSPLLSKVIFQATKDVNCPDQSHQSMSIHHNWASKRPINASVPQPQLDPLGTSSDAAPFLMLAGVPSVDLQYIYDQDNYAAPKYPTFRTGYDQAENINSLIDPDFSIHAAVTEVAVRALVTLADTPKLSMDLNDYAKALKRYIQQFKDQYGELLMQHSISLDQLETSIERFLQMAQTFQDRFDAMDETDELMVREMNDHVLSVERAFLVNEGFTLNPESRHLIYGADVTSVYKGAPFGPLAQMIVMEKELGNWYYVEETLAYTVLGLDAASGILADAQLH